MSHPSFGLIVAFPYPIKLPLKSPPPRRKQVGGAWGVNQKHLSARPSRSTESPGIHHTGETYDLDLDFHRFSGPKAPGRQCPQLEGGWGSLCGPLAAKAADTTTILTESKGTPGPPTPRPHSNQKDKCTPSLGWVNDSLGTLYE